MSKRGLAEKPSSEVDGSGEPPKKIAPIFLPKQRPVMCQGTWRVNPGELFVFTPENIEHRGKIAAFDLDGTLIVPKSGGVFAKHSDDWQLQWPEVAVKLQEHHQKGFKIVIFSNQRGLLTGSVDPVGFKRKIANIVAALGVPVQVFISIGSANYRKPYIGMWKRLEEYENGAVPIDKTQSLYVGDAAGRIRTNNCRKADHSKADRLFASNADLRFHTPEEFFLGKHGEEPYEMPEYPVAELLKAPCFQYEPAACEIPSATTELIVIVGPPASGKSTLSASLAQEHGYAVVSQDVLGSKKACVDKAKRYLMQGKSVVVDNTNRNHEARACYVELAREFNVATRCFVVECSSDKSRHNNLFRQIIGADEKHKGVSEIVIRTFFSSFQRPTPQEGFSEIVSVHVMPLSKMSSDEMKKVYRMYLLEK